MSKTWEAMKADSKEVEGMGMGGALLTGHIGVSTFISGLLSQNNSGSRAVQGLRVTVSMRTGVGGSFFMFFFFFFDTPQEHSFSKHWQDDQIRR